MEKTTKNLINSIFDNWIKKRKEAREFFEPEIYKNYKKHYLESLSKIFDLNSKIEISDITSENPKPAFFKKLYDDYNFIYIIVSNLGFIYSYQYDNKLNPIKTDIYIDSYANKSEPQMRKEANKIYLLKQDYKFIQKVNEKKRIRYNNQDFTFLSKNRFFIKKGSFYKYCSNPEDQQRYNIINSIDKSYTYKFNLTQKEVSDTIDKSGYIKYVYNLELKRKLEKFKEENRKKDFSNYKNFDDDFNFLNNEIEKQNNNILNIDIKTILSNKTLFKKYSDFINYFFETKEKIEKLKSNYKTFDDLDLYNKKINNIKDRFIDFENYILNEIIESENHYYKWDERDAKKFWFNGEREHERAEENKILINYLKSKNINLEKLNQLNKISYDLIKEELC